MNTIAIFNVGVWMVHILNLVALDWEMLIFSCLITVANDIHERDASQENLKIL